MPSSSLSLASTFLLGILAALATTFMLGTSSSAALDAFMSRIGLTSGECLSYDEAHEVGFLWQELIGNFSKETAEAALVPNYTDYAAAALSLNNVCHQAKVPPMKATDPLFTSREIFIMAQGSQAPIPSTKLNLWHGCRTVTMRYQMCIKGDCTMPVIGLIAIETVKVGLSFSFHFCELIMSKAPAGNRYKYMIETTYSEFDSAAWTLNLKRANNCVDPASIP